MFEDMGEVRPPAQSLKESPSFTHAAPMLDHCRKPGHQSVVETGNLCRRCVFQRAQVHPGFQHGMPGPDVWTSKSEHLTDDHKFNTCNPVNVGPADPVNSAESIQTRIAVQFCLS